MIYCAYRHIVFTLLPLLKKLLCLQLEVQLPLLKNALVIIKFIDNKMVWIYLFCYIVKIRLPARGSLIFCKNKNGVFIFFDIIVCLVLNP